ncbi:MAG: phosphoglucosamine mutase, partial [Opitutales bacterium]|nr:phosphoglucosamine mutase [Opitutales bacterium]
GKLANDSIVTTLQSNIGLDESLKENGISVYRSGIGDRLVMREMLAHNAVIGGENSGHFIFSEVSPCGDGLAAALAVLSVMSSKNGKLSELRGGIKMYPQLAKAIAVARKTPIDQTENLAGAMARCGEILDGEGRLLIRYSGTEKKIRLLAEGKDLKKVERCMELLEKAVELDLQ